MKTKAFLPAIVFLLASLASCNSSVPKSLVTDDGSVRIIENPDGPLYICDLKAAGDTIDIPLSELVEDCRIVRFETSDEALFKAWWIEVSDNYICVRQQSNVVKLYDKDGKFLCNIGAMGNGPGEYPVTIYDGSIDERGGHIFLSLFYGKKIMMYGLDGKWIKDINLPGQINKPKIEVNADGTLSVVHMPLKKGRRSLSGWTRTGTSYHRYRHSTICWQEISTMRYFPTEIPGHSTSFIPASTRLSHTIRKQTN